MFKSCRKKKKHVEEACGVLSWRPIDEPNVVWPVKKLNSTFPISDNEKETNKIIQNGNLKATKIETKLEEEKVEKLETYDIDPPKIANVEGPDRIYQQKCEELYKTETLKTYIVEKPQKIEVENVDPRIDVKLEQIGMNLDQPKVEKRETYELDPPKIANVEGPDEIYQQNSEELFQTAMLKTYIVEKPRKIEVENNIDPVYEVKYQKNSSKASDFPQIVEPTRKQKVRDEIEVLDANGNHIPKELSASNDRLNLEPKKSIDSIIDFRNSSTSTHSLLSSDARLSGVSAAGSAVMMRRVAFRDDEEVEDIRLEPQEISKTDAETIKKALEANNFIMAVAPNAVDEIARYMTLTEVRKGDIIMKQGEQGNSMYVSKVGEFKVEMNNQTLSKFKGPRLFGELAILYGTDRSATVVATTNGSVWQLQRQVFRKILRSSNILARDNLLEFLRKVPVIKEASVQKLRQIADLCECKYFKKDTVIIREGQRGEEFYIIKTGKVSLSKFGKGNFLTLGPGDYFGERALLYDDDKRKATVTASDYGVYCLVITRQEFREYLGDLRNFVTAKDEPPKILQTKVEKPDERRFEPYKQIQLKELKQVKHLGEGGFGSVNLVKSSKGKLFALKEMKMKTVQEQQSMKRAMNEKDIQRACDSIFIVQLYRTFTDDANIYFLLEYCPRGELFKLLRKKKYFDQTLAKFTGACVLEALAYLHSRWFAYLDLKPENIFIDMNGYPKIGDFGNALRLEPGEKSYCFVGTPEYMAPEIIQQSGTDMAADYWAFGVLIYEMLLGKSPFYARTPEILYNNISKGLTGKHFPQGFDKAAKDLIKRLIDLNPAKRIGYLKGGMQTLYRHEWFKDIDFVKLRAKSLRSPLLSLYKK